MRILILALCTIGAAFAHEELLSRENEPVSTYLINLFERIQNFQNNLLQQVFVSSSE